MREEDANWKQLRDAYAAGSYEDFGSGSARRVQFEDGSLWFPHGLERVGTGSFILPMMGGLFLVALAGSIVTIADGSPYWWCFVLGLGIIIGVLAVLLRAESKADAVAEAQLEVGLFLFSDRAVLKAGRNSRVILREHIQNIHIRQAHRGGSKSVAWVHLIVKSGDRKEEVSTDLRASAELLQVLRNWGRF